ncbi:MAG: glycosyltransferase [Bacteroidota bacterium]
MTLDFILLIPVHNNTEGLINSIKSVNYPSEKHEILIIDDGSSNPILIEDLIRVFPDKTIEIVTITKNAGILNALNTGLKHIHDKKNCKYIARLDCGDICHADRFYKQVEFLDLHKDISLLGTWCIFIDYKTGKYYLYKTKTNHEDIKREMHFKCSFIHPTVMFRSEIIDITGYYPEKFAHAEDYAYFCLILKATKGAILPETLVDIEVSNNSISSKNYKVQLKSRMKIVRFFGEDKLLALGGITLLFARYILPLNIIRLIKSGNNNNQ